MCCQLITSTDAIADLEAVQPLYVEFWKLLYCTTL